MDPIRVQSECQVRDQLRVEARQLRVEREVCTERKTRVALWSSLLVGGIAASLIITRATPGTSASFIIKCDPSGQKSSNALVSQIQL